MYGETDAHGAKGLCTTPRLPNVSARASHSSRRSLSASSPLAQGSGACSTRPATRGARHAGAMLWPIFAAGCP